MGLLKYIFIVSAAALLMFCIGCTGTPAAKANLDAMTKGNLTLSIDESFKPVMAEQVKVFSASYPDIHMTVTYKSEADCLKDLDSGKATMIITAKPLTPSQENYYQNKQSYIPRFDKLAYDAVALILNKEATDTIYSLKRLKATLTGQDTTHKIILDGTNATSTVRYMIDSITRGAALGKNVLAVNGSEEVIKYIATHKGALGFVGLSWVGNPQDTAQVELTKDVKFGLLPCRLCADSGMYAKPSQQTIALNQYPLVRPMFYILNENSAGKGTNFLNFLSLERGQLIFRRAYLFPAKMNFSIRKSEL